MRVAGLDATDADLEQNNHASFQIQAPLKSGLTTSPSLRHAEPSRDITYTWHSVSSFIRHRERDIGHGATSAPRCLVVVTVPLSSPWSCSSTDGSRLSPRKRPNILTLAVIIPLSQVSCNTVAITMVNGNFEWPSRRRNPSRRTRS